MKILITGVTGLIGKELALYFLNKGDSVFGITRTGQCSFLPSTNIIKFDLEDTIDPSIIKNFDAIIHLAGYPIAKKRWNSSVKKMILGSRVESTKNLVTAINKLEQTEKPKIFISGSATGIYGKSYLATVCEKWESEAQKIQDVPLAIFRTGIVLSSKGGALAEMPPVVLSDGSMKMSWIHITDWVNACDFILSHKYSGTYDLVAPETVTQKEFVNLLIKAKKIPFKLWSPLIFPQLFLGEMASALFESLEVKPDQLLKQGFTFKFSNLEKALTNIYADKILNQK